MAPVARATQLAHIYTHGRLAKCVVQRPDHPTRGDRLGRDDGILLGSCTSPRRRLGTRVFFSLV